MQNWAKSRKTSIKPVQKQFKNALILNINHLFSSSIPSIYQKKRLHLPGTAYNSYIGIFISLGTR